MSPPQSNTVYPVVRLVASLLLMTLGGSAMYAAIMVLEPAALEFGGGRSAGSLPYMLFMAGFGIGGVAMGRVADRIGILPPAIIGSLCVPAGFFVAAQAPSLGLLGVSLGILCGLFGASFTFAPLISDVSHWFVRRRGLAVGIVISGTYIAGAVWPPVLQHLFDDYGWRATFEALAVFNFLLMLPLCAFLYRRAPTDSEAGGAKGNVAFRRPLGFAPGALQCLLCAAGVGCCVGMSMPQVHIVPFVLDLGHPAARGAEMLSLMLGFGIVSRLVSGWLSDRIGGIRTMLLGSGLQATVLFAFLFADTLTALYATSIAFGLSQGGIVPSYAIIIRKFFPAGEAGWRIGTTLLFTIGGMALGGWLAAVLYDFTGSYTLSFVNAIGFNLLNMAIGGVLLMRARGLLQPMRTADALSAA